MRTAMNNKERVLAYLEQHMGEYLSGERLAEELGISRTAVWKHIKALRGEGCAIHSRTNCGYILEQPADVLSHSRMEQLLTTDVIGRTLTIYPETDSTNTRLKQLAAEGAPEGTVVLADRQTGGKGRMGRSFCSPAGNGIYMSVLLRPRLPVEKIQLVTILAALSVAEALRESAAVDARIKWVNDILVNGKKICGILTEGSFAGETGELDYLVVGIGVNIGSTAAFPEEVRQITTAVNEESGRQVGRCELTAAILSRFEQNYYLLTANASQLIARYKQLLCMLGQDITVISARENYRAVAVDISPMGGLIVRRGTGELLELHSGEISTRLSETVSSENTIPKKGLE